MSNQDKNRGTGRTQRGVVQAVSAMLMGKNVVHVSGSMSGMTYALDYASRWLQDNAWTSQDIVRLSIDTAAQTIRFGTAELWFISITSVRGVPADALVIYDHYVSECRDIAAKAGQEADKNTIARLMHKHQWGTIEGYGVQFHGDHQRAKLRLNLVKRKAE